MTSPTNQPNNPDCNHQTNPNCCKCRHILRWYVRECMNGDPKPSFESDFVYCGEQVGNTTFKSTDLYYLTVCDCCDRHNEARPTWDDLVKLCPDLMLDPQSNIDDMPPLECPGCDRYTSSGGKDYLDNNRKPVPVDYKYGCSCYECVD